MSIEGLEGKVDRLKHAAMSAEVKFWLECMAEIEERVIAANLNSKGEQAVQAWGIIQGISMCKRVDKIYEAELKDAEAKRNAHASAQIIKPR